MVEYFSPYMSDDIYRKSGFLNDVHVYLNVCDAFFLIRNYWHQKQSIAN